MGFCAVSPIRGKLFKTETEMMGDVDISRILDCPVEMWLERKKEVLSESFEYDEEGAICINKTFLQKIQEVHISLALDTPIVQEKIKAIQARFQNKLKPYQVIVEHYKDLKHLNDLPDWDKLYFGSASKIASNAIKKIGLENSIAVLDWMNSNYKSFSIRGLIESYQYYWKDIKRKEKIADERSKATTSEYL
jgi:hypothetical protein